MQNNTHWPQVLAMTTAGLLLIWILAIIWLYRYDHQAQAILPTKMPSADVALILGNVVYKNNNPNKPRTPSLLNNNPTTKQAS